MQENGKRLLSFLLAVVMIVSMMPISAFAQEQETVAQPSVETVQPEETLPQTAEPEETQSKPATKNETGEEYAALEFGVPMDVEYIGPYATWITFTPEEDGIYSFTLMSQEVVGCQIYDWNKEYIKTIMAKMDSICSSRWKAARPTICRWTSRTWIQELPMLRWVTLL